MPVAFGTPVPDSATVTTLAGEVATTLRLACRRPAAKGLKETVTLQVCSARTVVSEHVSDTTE